jgi:hypothetical protein
MPRRSAGTFTRSRVGVFGLLLTEISFAINSL